MVSAAAIMSLRRLSGAQLLDAAAKTISFPFLPSEASRPIEAAQPQLLELVRDGWFNAAEAVDDNITDLDRTSIRILDNWLGDSARAFFDYITRLVDVAEAQNRDLCSVPGPLEKIQIVLEDSQRSIANAQNTAVVAVGAVVAAGIAGIIAAGGPGASAVGAIPSVISATVAGLAGALASYVSYCAYVTGQLEAVISKANDEMEKLAERLSAKNIEEVAAPPPPELSYRGFHSINEPDDISSPYRQDHPVAAEPYRARDK